MNIGYILLGFIVGVLVAGGGWSILLGGVGGAVIGALAGRLVAAERRIGALEARLGAAAVEIRAAPKPAPSARAAATDRPVPGTALPHAALADAAEAPGPGLEQPHGPVADEAWPDEHAPPATAGGGEPFRAPSAPLRPSLLQVGLARAGAWFSHGNVPVKVGVILSFIGVAFLLKYAIDRELLVLPIEFRLLAVAAGGVILLVLGWRLRARLRVYALSLQGGGAGILFLTIFAAFRIWQLLPAPLAFGLLAALAAATGVLAVLQSSRSLIVLAATGGFLAPVLASTGQGSHVALFSYYGVLNAAILGVAWFRAWRELNLVGFVFTFVIGSLWGYRYYRPDLLTSTEPFLVLYFLFYNAIAILYALRQSPARIGLVDGTLVFGTPVIAFTLQAALMRGSDYGLAISAAVLALFYASLAVVLFRRSGERQRKYLRMLTESYLALAVAFATLAIPLALDARWTSAAWALEGAALVWVGTRQGRHLASLAGAALVGFGGIAFLEYGWKNDAGWPVVNGNVLGGVLISLGALFSARRLESFARAPLVNFYRVLAWLLFAWGVLWWLGTGGAEIGDRLRGANEMHAWLAFVALSALAGGWLGRARDWSKARALTVLYLPGLLLMVPMYLDAPQHHFLHGAGWLAWPLAFAVQAWLLRRMDAQGAGLAVSWHIGSLLLLTTALALEAAWQTANLTAGDWFRAAASAVPGFVALLVLRWRNQPAWPVPVHPIAYRGTAIGLVAVQFVYLAVVSVERPGDPAPLPYLPVLNPFDLAALYALLIAYVSLTLLRREAGLLAATPLWPWRIPYRALLALSFFVISTAALVRGVHHVTGVPWRFDSLFNSVVVQTALSIYWGLLGFAGMIGGARTAHRPLWLAGAGFMGMVVVKLFLVDLGNSGTIERIISFIGIGVLLLVVGYFAPVPPRQAHEKAAAVAGQAMPEGRA